MQHPLHQIYIGESSRQIDTRFGEHMRNVKHKTHLKEQHETQTATYPNIPIFPTFIVQFILMYLFLFIEIIVQHASKKIVPVVYAMNRPAL